MTALRYRIARWLVGGAYFRLPKDGTWLVNHATHEGHEFTFAIRVASWQGTHRTHIPSLHDDFDPTFPEAHTGGEFSGTFG